MKKAKTLKNKIFRGIAIALACLLVIVGGYVLYVVIDYSRIKDNQTLTVQGEGQTGSVQTGKTYTVVTQNMGFGAYTPDFTFFMDGGTQSWANSKESVENCIRLGAEKIKSFSPDFVFFQEIDTDSTRSYHTNQYDMMADEFSSYSNVFAVNYHSAFLMYPIFEPHGSSNSGILTLSKTKITSSIRRSLPISESFSKFLDLDRCYSVSRVPVETGKELVLFNVHLSAYGGSDEIRTAQMSMLFNDIKSEYEKGNYCVCGGDFNHDFTGNSTQKLNGVDGNADFGWAQPFPETLLPDCVRRCTDYKNGETVATCRNCDVAYGDDCFTIIVDGFLVTPNVNCLSVQNVSTGFTYSDHSPVVMQFELAN